MAPANVPRPALISTGTRIDTGTVVVVAPLLTMRPPNDVPAAAGALTVILTLAVAPGRSVTLDAETFMAGHVALWKKRTCRWTTWVGSVGIMLARGKMSSSHGWPAVTTGRWSAGPVSET